MHYNDRALAEEKEATYLIEKGVRDAALVTLRDPNYYDTVMEDENHLLEDIAIDCLSRNLKYKFIPFTTKEGEDYIDVFIYKYDHQWEMYQTATVLTHSEENEAVRAGEWMIGKLLGYSEESIGKYLNNQKYPNIVEIKLPDDFYEKNVCTKFSKFGADLEFKK